jgi:hypothetical protein
MKSYVSQRSGECWSYPENRKIGAGLEVEQSERHNPVG